MQDITKSKCDSIASGTEGRLIDSRDGKIYWVAKLKDGLCWMTQNLDYDGGGESGTSFNSTSDPAQYFDPGEYAYLSGPDMVGCAPTYTDGFKDCTKAWISVSEIETYWISSSDAYFVDATNYLGTDGYSICNKVSGSVFGNAEFPQCRIYYHYEHALAGNYYNWLAATNGTGTNSLSSGDASGSICPTGWKLPTSNNSKLGSFDLLVSGLTMPQLTSNPYYFLYMGAATSGFSGVGTTGYYWSSTAYSGGTYSLRFNSSNGIKPANNDYSLRYYGYPVRCVAR